MSFARRWSIRNLLTALVVFVILLAVLVIVLDALKFNGSGSALVFALKIVAAIGLLAVWVALNIPPPRPPSGNFVLSVAEFGEQVADLSKPTKEQAFTIRQVPRSLMEELNLEFDLRSLLNFTRVFQNRRPAPQSSGAAVATLPTRQLRPTDLSTTRISEAMLQPTLPLAVAPDDARDLTDQLCERITAEFREAEAPEAALGRAPFAASETEALERARTMKATALLWGWLKGGNKRERYFQPVFHILRPIEAGLLGEREEMRMAGLGAVSISAQRAARPNTLLYLIGGLACYAGRDYQQAVSEFKMALVSAIIAADDDGAALADQAITRFYLANSYYLLGENAAAEHEYQLAIKADPLMAEAYQNLAVVQRAQGRLDEAARNLQAAVRLSPNAVSALYDLGIVYINQNQPARARAAFQKALSITTASSDGARQTGPLATASAYELAAAHRGLALAYRAEGKLPLALSHLQEALKVYPQYAVVHMDLAAIYHAQGENERAERELLTALDTAPNMAEAHYNLGLIYRSDGKVDAAADQFRDAIQMKPDFSEAHYDLGLLYKSQGQLDLAVRQFKEATTIQPADAETFINLGLGHKEEGDLSQAAQQFRQAISLEPNNAEAHLQLASVYQASGDAGAAVGEYETALKLNPNLASAYQQLAVIYRGRKQYDEAISWLQKAIRQNRRDAYAYYLMGTVHVAQRQYDQAFEAFRIAINYNPDLAEAHYNLGVVLTSRGRQAEAVTEFEQVIRLKPDDPQAYFVLGIAQRDQQHYDDAAEALANAARLNPDWAEARYNLGRVYLAAGKPELALAELLDTLRLQPDNDKARYQLASAYAAAGRISSAIETFIELLRHDPNNAEAYYNLGIAYTGLGQYENAARSFYSATRLRPTDAEAFNSLGIALKTLGRVDEAIAAFKQAVAIKPDYAQSHYNLGQAYTAINAVSQAIEEFHKYEELGGKIGR